MKSIAHTNYFLTSAIIIVWFAFVSIGDSNESVFIHEIPSVESTFLVTFKSKTNPIPLNEIHQWMVHIKTSDHQPVEDATILIDGGMPIHNHGLPTHPVATEIGGGDYIIDGVKFSMRGDWEVWIYISTEKLSDKVRVNLTF